MVHLPNLDDLLLWGSLVAVGGRTSLPRIGAILRGRFGGQLGLLGGLASEDVVNMLLEIPTGLRFTEVQIRGTCECLLSVLRLAEACGKTLVKLSYAAPSHYGETFERSFDFSKFPNLQEVDVEVSWMSGGLRWVPAALSTLRSVTSPHLSAIRLNFVRPPTVNRSVQAMIECTGNDLRRVADEVTRIEREFEGAVNLTVPWDPGFGVVFDTLNILRRWR